TPPRRRRPRPAPRAGDGFVASPSHPPPARTGRFFVRCGQSPYPFSTMPTAILPDGSRRELPPGASSLDLARTIGEGLASAAIGARVDGTLVDVARPLPEGEHEVAI